MGQGDAGVREPSVDRMGRISPRQYFSKLLEAVQWPLKLQNGSLLRERRTIYVTKRSKRSRTICRHFASTNIPSRPKSSNHISKSSNPLPVFAPLDVVGPLMLFPPLAVPL